MSLNKIAFIVCALGMLALLGMQYDAKTAEKRAEVTVQQESRTENIGFVRPGAGPKPKYYEGPTFRSKRLNSK